jgi:peptide-methionine (S)-S-oxide reductase
MRLNRIDRGHVMRNVIMLMLLATMGGTALVVGQHVKTGARGPTQRPTQQATFAAGCFWGVEDAFRKLDGVVSTTAGFSGGHVANPSYRQVSSGGTGHAEAVLVVFDPRRISYAELLDAFWSCHDPTRPREPGEPHRSIIFVRDPQQRAIAIASRDEVQGSRAFGDRHIATRIAPASDFYPADDEHQQYLARHGRAATCSVGEVEVHTHLAAQAKESSTAR